MKVHRMITLDYEIALKLEKEHNASFLINSLLIANYKKNKYEGWTTEQFDTEIEALRLEEKAKKVRDGK